MAAEKRSMRILKYQQPKKVEQVGPFDYVLRRRDRFWEVLDPTGQLICMTVYKCGGQEVIRRLREGNN
jgi:hypothetical protein